MAATAIAILLLGVVWRFAGWILEWIGRLLGARGLTSSYDAFVEGYVGMLMTDGSLAKILGPWLLMGVGLILLAVLYLPVRKSRRAADEQKMPNAFSGAGGVLLRQKNSSGGMVHTATQRRARTRGTILRIMKILSCTRRKRAGSWRFTR